MAADALTRMGYQNVYSLQGGLGRWQREGYKVLDNKPVYSGNVVPAVQFFNDYSLTIFSSDRIEYRAKFGPKGCTPFGKTYEGQGRYPDTA